MNPMIGAEDRPNAGSGSPVSLGAVIRCFHKSFDHPAPAAFLPAFNEAAFDHRQSTTGELAAWAKRTSMANGFGEIGLCGESFASALSRHDQQQARGNWSASLREILAAMLAAVRDLALGRTAHWKRYQLQRATYNALRELDSRTLHDIGLTRSELRSIAVELTGASEPTRAHALVQRNHYS